MKFLYYTILGKGRDSASSIVLPRLGAMRVIEFVEFKRDDPPSARHTAHWPDFVDCVE